MATQEFQYIQDILKDWYAPAIINQIYTKSPLWAVVKKTSKGVTGRKVYIPLRATLSEAVGSLKAGEYSLPTAGKIGYDSTTIWQKRNYGRVQVDGLAIEASKGKGGWIDAFTGETRGIAESYAIDIDRQVMGRGTSIIGLCTDVWASGNGGTDSIEVDSPAGINNSGFGNEYSFFRKGMKLAIWQFDADAEISENVTGEFEIDSVDTSYAPTDEIFINLQGAAASGVTIEDGDYLIRRGSDGFGMLSSVTHAEADSATTGGGDIMVIERIVDADPSGTLGTVAAPSTMDWPAFQGIDGSLAANSFWRALVRSSRGILTEMKIQEDLDAIEQQTDGDTPNLALTTYALRNKLLEIVKSDRMVQNINFVAGWEGIKYQGGAAKLPIMVHKFCPTGYWYYLNMKYISFYTLKKLIWDSSGGGIIKPVTGEDQYEAWFKMYGNMGVNKRNAFGKATGYTTS